ncbi:MAG: hypothetical protein QOH63_458 [Acidobacteriota bacterium]|nr:hypothetical protein [Acidobacteriota bacterium]
MSLRFVQRARRSKFLFSPLVGLFVLILGSGCAAFAGQQRQSREITSEDFIRNRPSAEASKTVAKSNPSSRPASKINAGQPSASSKRKRRIYRLVSTQTTGAKTTAAASPPASKLSADSTTEQVGITIWRLRASTAADSGPKIPVHESGGTTWWSPERTLAGTLFKIGERVRLSIESPLAGYLYVIDREQYADGTLGAPSLIFPTLKARGGDNRVSAGLLIEIPDQGDRIPYFNLTRGRNDQVGEILTVLITSEPLREIPLAYEQPRLSTAQVAQWENMWTAQAELFEMEGGAGARWTKEEQQAGTALGRSLTQEEPTPQTIYRVRVKAGNPLLVTVPLRYGGDGQ